MAGRAIQSPEVWLGGGLMLLAIGVAVEGATITSGFGYDTVGPRSFPYLIAAGLFVSGVSTCAKGVSSRTSTEPFQRGDWRAVGAISFTLIAQTVLINLIGWIPTTTATFAIVAWVFGSRQVVRNLLFGFTLAAATLALFNLGLGFRLPTGSLVEMLF